MAAAGAMKKRSPNYSGEEKNLLIDLFVKYQDVIQNKKTDNITRQIKEATWQQIEAEFMAEFPQSVGRGWRHLLSCFCTLKKYTKKASKCKDDDVIKVMDAGREFLMGTVSSSNKPAHVVVLPDGRQFLMQLGNTGQRQIVEANGEEFEEAEVEEFEYPAVTAQDEELNSNSAPMSFADELNLSTHTSMHASSKTDSSDDETPLTVDGSSNPVRLLPIRHLPPSGSSMVASGSQPKWAIAKERYYQEKLEMARREHEVRMQLLTYQEEVYRKKMELLDSKSKKE